jgi:putative ABC transport system permease protein
MIKNHFKIAWRSLWRYKAYSAINIIGLSIGLTACLIVATVVFDELSYDQQWSKKDSIYRVLSKNSDVKGENFVPATFSGFGPNLKKDLPEVNDYCRMSVIDDHLILTGDKEGIAFKNLRAEPSIWNILDFKVLQGDPHKFVKGYTNLIITKQIADKYFAGQNPIGKIIKNQPQYGLPQQYVITGVIDNIPQNTHLRADVITLEEHSTFDDQMAQINKGFTFLPVYILLKPHTDINAFTAKVNNWYTKQANANTPKFSFGFQSIKDVYLRSANMNWYEQVHGSITTVYIFAGVAALLLMIACINFINLTISRVFSRTKETGIRKVLGAEKLQLIARFITESILFFVIAFCFALLLYPFFIKPVETYLGHQLVLSLYNTSFLLLAVGGIFLLSLLTGLYPAWFLSRPNPIVIVRKNNSGFQLNALKKGLVVGQFVVSIGIIMATIIVRDQISFINHKNLGFDKNNLLNLSFTMWGQSAPAFKQAVKQLPGVENASIANWAPAEGAGSESVEKPVPGQKEKMTIYFITGDVDLVNTLGFKLNKGRYLNPQFASDAMNADSAMNGRSEATMMQALHKPLLATNYTANLLKVKLNNKLDNMNGVPVGILQDFNAQSLHETIKPTFIQAVTGLQYGNMLIRVKPGSESQVLAGLNKAYKSFYPDKTFQYNWISDEINDQYKAEHKLQQLFTCFSLLIIFLACLGLFGLVSFTVEQRVKEIGIRKVLGAGVGNIVALISKDYLGLVVLSIVIASPIAWYAMNKWLQDFAYRVHIQWWVFALSGIAALIIALITVSFQSVKAAIANPVKSLRSE